MSALATTKNKSMLITACKDCDLEAVRTALGEDGVDVNEQDEEGVTALRICISIFGTFASTALDSLVLDIIRLLLQTKDIQINQPSADGQTALWKASYLGHADIVRLLLLFKGINVNQCTNVVNDVTPLHAASIQGHADVVRLLLLAKDINVNQSMVDGLTATHQAILGSHIDVVQVLLMAKDIDVNQTDNNEWTPLELSQSCDHDAITELLQAHGATGESEDDDDEEENDDDEEEEDHGPLFTACAKGDLDAVRVALAADGVDVNERHETSYGYTALYEACCRRDVNIVRLLLQQKDIDVNLYNLNDGTNALTVAKRAENNELIHLLEEHGALDEAPYPERRGDLPLFKACASGDLDAVRKELNQVGDLSEAHGVNQVGGMDRDTALFVACEGNEIDIVRLLLDCEGIDVHKTGVISPIQFCQYENYDDIAKLLLEHLQAQGEEIDAEDQAYLESLKSASARAAYLEAQAAAE